MKIISFISTTTRRIVKRPPPIVIPTTPPLLQAPVPRRVEEQPQASSSTAPPLPPLGGKKRALLIGIQHQSFRKTKPTAKYKKRLSNAMQQVQGKFAKQPARAQDLLVGCHKDVRAMKAVLIDLYGYKEEDISVLTDEDDPSCILPTKENILNHLDKLVENAEPGDKFFFHFSGHSVQEPTEDPDEEDGMNELILTYDNETIGDNVLHEKLVTPLPIGATLTATFDTCHSATMLDLKHYRCNRVYVPWINKGKRALLTQQNVVVRKHAAPMSPVVKEGRKFDFRKANSRRPSINQRLGSPVVSKSGSGRIVAEPQRRRNVPIEAGSFGSDAHTPLSAVPHDLWLADIPGESIPVKRCASPEPSFCEGWCKKIPDGHLYHKEVISLSAAKDGQRAWEDSKGTSMTQVLVKRLRQTPNPTLHDLLLGVSHDLHDIYLDIHSNSRTYKKQAHIANTLRRARGKAEKRLEDVEMDNFQNPQISSSYPLDTQTKLWSP